MQIKSYMWIAPFICFLTGYFFIRMITFTPELATPSLVGKSLHESLCHASDMDINLRVITQKEEVDLEEGTILSQTPAAGTTIKPQQSLYVVIAKKPARIKAPHVIQLKKNDIEKLCEKKEIRVKFFPLESLWPEDTCFAQWPTKDQPLDTNEPLIAYISSSVKKPIIWPNFKGRPLEDVLIFLQEHGINPDITHTYAQSSYHTCHNCIVVDQRPLAGTITTLDATKPLSVQLRVQ